MQPILPDVDEAVSLLFLELLDACNHFVVQPVSIRSPSKSIKMVNFLICITYGVTTNIFQEHNLLCKDVMTLPKNMNTYYMRVA